MTQPAEHDASLCTAAWRALRRAHEQVARRLAYDLDRCCDLAISEFDALFHLFANRDAQLRMQDLLEAVALSQPALSRLVARLEARELLVRRPAADDGRVTLIRLSPAGEAMARKAIAIHAAAVEAVLSQQLTDREQRDLVAILGRAAGRGES